MPALLGLTECRAPCANRHTLGARTTPFWRARRVLSAITFVTRADHLGYSCPLICRSKVFTGRYEEAASGQKGNARTARFGVAGTCGGGRLCSVGKIVEAREAMARMRALDPSLRLSNLENVLAPYRREDRALYIVGQRRAGLPE